MPRRKGRDLKRRNARNRLLRYLTRGGALVKDETGLGFCKANRSGEAWPVPMVEKLSERGWKVGHQRFALVRSGIELGIYLARETA